MKKPDDAVIKGLAHIAQNSPAVYGWLIEQADMELSRLPSALNNMAVAQGRCQVLEELRKLLHDAPDLAAQLK